MRPTLDEYFMNIADIVATRSTCLRRQIGAVIVRDKRIISTGYNGAPRGAAHCLDIGCIREQENIESGTMHEICRAVHAEQNAVIQAALHGVSTQGSTLYCTHQPCAICAKILINAGIVRVIFRQPYPDNRAMKFFEEAGVEVEVVVRSKKN
ncbi:cytidine deaminase [ANME-2 cluster archaeon]|nr:MAG: cytidine deaminase [ANME-2 cluster archaeon]